MKTHKIHSGSGESLAEVMVSAVIFFIMMAVLQGAISFSTNAQHKSEEIREKNAQICRNLQTTSYVPGAESRNYVFKATTADGETPGSEAAVLFRIAVELGTKEVTCLEADGTSETITFYLYGTPVGESTGGDTP